MAEFDLVLRNGTVVTSAGRRDADIGVRDGRIASIEPRGALGGTGTDEVDAGGNFVLPGVIDGHVHFREPGMEYKEDWMTGSRAAVMGGVTTVLDMPNTIPQTKNVEGAQIKKEIAESKSFCDFGFIGLLVPRTSPTSCPWPRLGLSSATRRSSASPSAASPPHMTVPFSTAWLRSTQSACGSASTLRTTT